MTTLRGLAAYTVPKVDVLVSANVRSVPNAALGAGSTSATNGTSRNANATVPNTVVQQTLGRLPANGLANGTTTVNLLNPAQLYGDRITQVDMRFAKILRFSRIRAEVGVDLLQPVQHQRRHRLHRDVRLGDHRRDLAAAERDRGAAVRAVQSEVRLLDSGWGLVGAWRLEGWGIRELRKLGIENSFTAFPIFHS